MAFLWSYLYFLQECWNLLFCIPCLHLSFIFIILSISAVFLINSLLSSSNSLILSSSLSVQSLLCWVSFYFCNYFYISWASHLSLVHIHLFMIHTCLFISHFLVHYGKLGASMASIFHPSLKWQPLQYLQFLSVQRRSLFPHSFCQAWLRDVLWPGECSGNGSDPVFNRSFQRPWCFQFLCCTYAVAMRVGPG